MSNKPTKKPKFFCQYCDAEVHQNAKQCRNCGRFFASVNCASCGFVGESELFTNGCPVCGYAGSDKEKKNKPKYNIKKGIKIKFSREFSNDPLPLWMFLVPTIVLIILLVILLFPG